MPPDLPHQLHRRVSSSLSGAILVSQVDLLLLARIAVSFRLVLDLSCRRRPDGAARGDFVVVTNKWQHFTRFAVTRENLERLAGYCDEFLVHGVDAEVSTADPCRGGR